MAGPKMRSSEEPFATIHAAFFLTLITFNNMMHYRKGENIEKEIRMEDLPFNEFLPPGKDFLWMRVKGGTKVNNVVSFAKNALDKGEHRTIVWTGVGGGVVKTVSCAEIIKRTHPLYQLTRMSSTIIEEHWTPQMEGLDVIVVKREMPCLHILMSLDEFDDGVNGVQKPNVTENFFAESQSASKNASRGRRNRGEYRRQQNRNKTAKDSSDQRSETTLKQQPLQEQNQKESGENQSTNQPQNKGALRKQKNKNPKPRDNVNALQASLPRQPATRQSATKMANEAMEI